MTPTALVLAGGGARGAYEAGVLRFILQDLPRRAALGGPEELPPWIISGTSAGALNGVMGGAGLVSRDATRLLATTWQRMRLHHVFRVRPTELAGAPLRVVGLGLDKHPSLLDATPLHQMIRERLPWGQLDRALARGILRALVVTTTEVESGRTVLFVDQRAGEPLHIPHDEVVVVLGPVRADHCLASSAMPFLFAPVDVGGRLLVDGGLRLNTPLSPALRLGGERVLVISVAPTAGGASGEDRVQAGDLSLAFLAGKALNALMLDPVERDLSRVRLLNEVFAVGEQIYGEDFLDRINPVLEERRGAPFRKVDTMLMRPSEDLSAMAGAAWASGKVRAHPMPGLLLTALAAAEREDQADLLSFVLFDRAFTGEAESLGYRDALRREDELAAILGLG